MAPPSLSRIQKAPQELALQSCGRRNTARSLGAELCSQTFPKVRFQGALGQPEATVCDPSVFPVSEVLFEFPIQEMLYEIFGSSTGGRSGLQDSLSDPKLENTARQCAAPWWHTLGASGVLLGCSRAPWARLGPSACSWLLSACSWLLLRSSWAEFRKPRK